MLSELESGSEQKICCLVSLKVQWDWKEKDNMPITNPYLQLDQKIVGDIYTSTEPMALLTTLCDDLDRDSVGRRAPLLPLI